MRKNIVDYGRWPVRRGQRKPPVWLKDGSAWHFDYLLVYSARNYPVSMPQGSDSNERPPERLRDYLYRSMIGACFTQGY